MRNSTVVVVGFSEAQRRVLVQTLSRFGVNTVAVADEVALFQYLWPFISADRLAPRPALLVLDGMRVSPEGLELVGDVCRDTELLVNYQADAESGFDLLLESLRRRFRPSTEAGSRAFTAGSPARRHLAVGLRKQHPEQVHNATG